MSADPNDPVCGNCGKKRSEHMVEPYPGEPEPREYCFPDTTGDLFSDEPNDYIITGWIQEHRPDVWDEAIRRWRIENGHLPDIDAMQAETCKHGTPFRYECDECLEEIYGSKVRDIAQFRRDAVVARAKIDIAAGMAGLSPDDPLQH